MRQIILDTETTGLYANAGDRIIEFAGLEMISRRLTGKQCHFYIYPDCDINEEASKVHGITLADLDGKPRFAEVGQEIHDFLRGSELIIHNAPFDIGFLNMEFSKMGLAPVEEIAENVIDTLVEAKRKYPGKRNSLDALCERLEVDRSKRVLHGALIDCDLLAQVYLAMTHNQFTLDIDLNSDSNTDGGQKSNIDYSARNFKIVMASADENKVHEAYLDKLSQTCTPIYRNEE
ncbi:DNA polymerase III subunit epsilon [Neisseriaceae bacterium PsAf]|nr:DNA polymerase III subunit epsilon [Neisseriaceae bacterium PsAf]